MKIKLYENFNKDELDPLGEEDWEEKDSNKKLYISNDPNICPVCGGELDFNYHEVYDYTIEYSYKCMSCNFIGAELYNLVFSTHIDDDHNDIVIGTPVNLNSFDEYQNDIFVD